MMPNWRASPVSRGIGLNRSITATLTSNRKIRRRCRQSSRPAIAPICETEVMPLEYFCYNEFGLAVAYVKVSFGKFFTPVKCSQHKTLGINRIFSFGMMSCEAFMASLPKIT